MKAWLFVGIIIASTTIGDLLQSKEMKRHGEIDDFHPTRLGRVFAELMRRRNLILAIGCMAVSFFSFLYLLSIADLSFAVPASAGSYVAETVLARFLLKEQVDLRRWAGCCLVACGVALLAA